MRVLQLIKIPAFSVLTVIGVIQIATGVMLYRYRVFHHQWPASDSVVLFGPPMLAAALDTLAVTSKGHARANLAVAIAIACSYSLVAFLATMLINLNLYGS
jgi:hypothetical protein